MLSREQIKAVTAVERRILYGDGVPLPAVDTEYMRELFYLHGLESMVDCADDPALASLQKPENVFGHMLYQRTLDHTRTFLFQQMNIRGIKAAELKGAAISECYPSRIVRTSGDLDLFVPGRQREAFTRMMEETGIERISDVTTGQCGVDTFGTAGGVRIEVHYLYFQRMSARQRGILRDRGYFSEEVIVPSADGRYCTLRPEVHLLYLIYHAGKHMLVHTITLRMLMDLTAFVNRYADEIDGAAFRRLIKELGFTRICNALMCFCMAHLGMRKDFWKRTGCPMDFFLRLMMNSGREPSAERFIRRMPETWTFYQNDCVEEEGEFRSQNRYRPGKALKSKFAFSTFTAWWAVRLLWHYEVDFSGEAV